MSHSPLSPARRALGYVLGIALGLFADTLLLLWLRAAAGYLLVFSLGLVFIAPLVAGVRLGLAFARARPRREPPWWALIALALALWPTAAGLPFGARLAQLRLFAPRAVPVHPAAARTGLKVLLGDNENSSDRVILAFTAASDSLDILQFYREQLVAAGWQDAAEVDPGRTRSDSHHAFRQRKSGGLRRMEISFEPPRPGGRLKFSVEYHPAGPLGV